MEGEQEGAEEGLGQDPAGLKVEEHPRLAEKDGEVEQQLEGAPVELDEAAGVDDAHGKDDEVAGEGGEGAAVDAEAGDEQGVEDDVRARAERGGDEGGDALLLGHVDAAQESDETGEGGGQQQEGGILPRLQVFAVRKNVDDELAEEQQARGGGEDKRLIGGEDVAEKAVRPGPSSVKADICQASVKMPESRLMIVGTL